GPGARDDAPRAAGHRRGARLAVRRHRHLRRGRGAGAGRQPPRGRWGGGVARRQASNRVETDVWAEELRAMPRGMPQPGDQGLDHTHTWGRTYWGGAMFCLIADVTIRERTQNRLGLQEALRAVLAASGGLSAHWPIERVLRTADAAVGVKVLEELYAKYGDAPVNPDLAQLWRQLGVERDGDSVRLDDSAPL